MGRIVVDVIEVQRCRNGAEIGRERRHALVSGIRIGRQSPQDYRIELLRHMRIRRARRRGSPVQRPTHGEHFIEDGAY